MKLEKATHDHLLTKWLKVIIFSLLMLAPLLSIGVRCAYVVCNKNAYQSYSGSVSTSLYEKVETTISASNTFEQGKYYTFEGDLYNLDGTQLLAANDYFDFTLVNGYLTVDNGYAIGDYYFTFYAGQNEQPYTFKIYEDAMVLYLQLPQNEEGYTILEIGNNCAVGNFTFYLNNVSINGVENPLNYFTPTSFTITNYNNYVSSTLDNVFDYSVNQLSNDQLFNWTQNTGVYTGVNAMCTGIGIPEGAISILITYWMLLTVIYVVIDIVLTGFTILTHMIYKKVE